MMSAMVLVSLLSATSGEASWVPWYGCFNLVEDHVREPIGLEAEESADVEPAPSGLVCLTPEVGGVRVRTFSGSEAFLEETLIADGTRYDVTKGNCRGWQKLDWSKDGQRLYSLSELTCEDGRKRSVSGVSLIDDRSIWLDIQSVGSGEARAVITRRYRVASEEVSLEYAPELTPEILRDAARARAEASVARLSIDDVIDASSWVEPETLEAMLVERATRFPLDRETLLELSDASVHPRVIDLMVALSFPEQFVVDRGPAYGGGGFGRGYSTLYDPFYSSAYAYPYYFAPFGYYYWYTPSNPSWIGRPGEGAGEVGRVVAGRGYTRVSPTPDEGGFRRTKRGGSSGSSSSSGESGSSGGSATSSGYSSGGSGSRTAKPKQNQ